MTIIRIDGLYRFRFDDLSALQVFRQWLDLWLTNANCDAEITGNAINAAAAATNLVVILDRFEYEELIAAKDYAIALQSQLHNAIVNTMFFGK